MAASSRVWLITGANSGLGLALARYCVQQGDNVIAAVRTPQKLPEDLAASSACRAVQLDLAASTACISAAAQKALAVYGRVDVLVNNAGYCLAASIEASEDEASKSMFQANFFGALSLTRALLPSLRSAAGTVLFVSSVAAFAGGGGFGVYNASKAALEAAAEALAAEEPAVTVRIIVPGYFRTPFWSREHAEAGEGTKSVDLMRAYEETHAEKRQVGDAEKAAARMWELVDGSGVGGVAAGARRVLLGPDAGERVRAKLEVVKQEVLKTEEVWRSTDMEM